MAKNLTITADYIKSILSYDPDTGIFTWLARPDSHFVDKMHSKSWNTMHCNKIAGSSKTTTGYIHITINGKKFQAHRLAFIMMGEPWPENEVDHINNIRNDNRWSNLRHATQSQNKHNIKLTRRNKSGYKGVSWSKGMKKWLAQISVNNIKFDLGYYNNLCDAVESYKNASIELHQEYSIYK